MDRSAPSTLLDLADGVKITQTIPILAHSIQPRTHDSIDREQETFLRAYQRAKKVGQKDIAQNVVDAAAEHYADSLDRLIKNPLRPCPTCGTLVAAT